METIEVDITLEDLKRAKRVKEEKLTQNQAKQFDLGQEEKKLRTDIAMITNWLYERKN